MSDSKKEQYKKTHQDFLDELNEQVLLMIDYCHNIDQGKYYYCKPLATAIRVVVHQSGSSTSLLKHLGVYGHIKLLSTSKTYQTKDEIIILLTLIAKATQVKATKDGIHILGDIFVPMLDTSIHKRTKLKLFKWYEKQIVLISNEIVDGGLVDLFTPESERLQASRMSIVTFFANKSGGAHVDSESEKSLYRLSKNLSSFDYYDEPLPRVGQRHIPGKPVLYPLQAALRQIAHELILSLINYFNLDVLYSPSHVDILEYNIKNSSNHCITYNKITREINMLH